MQRRNLKAALDLAQRRLAAAHESNLELNERIVRLVKSNESLRTQLRDVRVELTAAQRKLTELQGRQTTASLRRAADFGPNGEVRAYAPRVHREPSPRHNLAPSSAISLARIEKLEKHPTSYMSEFGWPKMVEARLAALEANMAPELETPTWRADRDWNAL